jgi:hypothetical protein
MKLPAFFQRIIGQRWAAIAWTVIIFILLALPGSSFPEQGILGKFQLDKIVHAGIFGTFVFLWYSWWSGRQNRGSVSLRQMAWLLFLIGSLYGAGMEFYQKYFTSREFEIADIVADSVGAWIGAVWCIWVKK